MGHKSSKSIDIDATLVVGCQDSEITFSHMLTYLTVHLARVNLSSIKYQAE